MAVRPRQRTRMIAPERLTAPSGLHVKNPLALGSLHPARFGQSCQLVRAASSHHRARNGAIDLRLPVPRYVDVGESAMQRAGHGALVFSLRQLPSRPRRGALMVVKVA